jgi:hypothetical protein
VLSLSMGSFSENLRNRQVSHGDNAPQVAF